MWAPKLIYVIGEALTGNTTNINQVFNPQNNKWSMAESMPNDRAGLAVAVVNDTIYALGGSRTIIHGDPISPNEYANVTSNVGYDLGVNQQYFPIGYIRPIPPYTIPYATPTPTPNPSSTTTPSSSPTFTTSPSPPNPSPTIPEFTPAAILILSVAACLVAVTIKKGLKHKSPYS